MPPKKPTIAEIVALEGIPVEEKGEQPIHIMFHNATLHGADFLGLAHMAKPLESMTEEEKEAYLGKRWDGIDRRVLDENEKEHQKALRTFTRRQKDRQVMWMHNLIVFMLLTMILGSAMLGLMLKEGNL